MRVNLMWLDKQMKIMRYHCVVRYNIITIQQLFFAAFLDSTSTCKGTQYYY